jgi:hypothetical protein
VSLEPLVVRERHLGGDERPVAVGDRVDVLEDRLVADLEPRVGQLL